MPWSVTGTYLEACNCDAICPCRRVGGRAGGRSTHGVCMGALSWIVTDGAAGDTDLSGLAAVLASCYDDDEAGSPWTYALYVDERGTPAQQEALAAIFSGALGGSALEHFPWAWKQSRSLGWRPAPIEIDHTPRRGWFRVSDRVTVRVRGPVDDQEPVTCVIPGHDREGIEVHVDTLEVREDGLAFGFEGVCGYEATFSYAG